MNAAGTSTGGEQRKRLTPVKAIRAKCLDCCCQQIVEVRFCTANQCPLHPYRMGKRPETMQKNVPGGTFPEDNHEGYSDTTEATESEETEDSPAFSAKDGEI